MDNMPKTTLSTGTVEGGAAPMNAHDSDISTEATPRVNSLEDSRAGDGIDVGDSAEDYLLVWKSDAGTTMSKSKAKANDDVCDSLLIEDVGEGVPKRGRGLSFKKQLCDRKRNAVDDTQAQQPNVNNDGNDEAIEPSSKRRRSHKSIEQSNSTSLHTPHPWTAAEDEKLLDATRRYAGQGVRRGMPWVKIREEFGGTRTATQCFHRYKVLITKQSAQIVSGHWTDEETAKLVEAVGLFDGQARAGGISWVKVSAHLDGRRTPNQCCQRWNETVKYSTSGGPVKSGLWTPLEDDRLTAAVVDYQRHSPGSISWVKISQALGGERTHNQCFKRWTVVLKHRQIQTGASAEVVCSAKHAGSWQPHEDAALVEAVRLFDGQGHGGSVSWVKVSEYLGGRRTSVQCRARYVNSLQRKVDKQSDGSLDSQPANAEELIDQSACASCNPSSSVKHGPWTAAEDTRLAESVALHDDIRGLYSAPGRSSRISWVRVSEHMGGLRAPTQCRERWNSVLKHKTQLGSDRTGGSGRHGDNESIEQTSRTAAIMGGALVDAVTVTTKRTGHWAAEEDEWLVRYVRDFVGKGCGGGIAWTDVSRMMGNGRTPNQCFKRWSTALKQKVGPLGQSTVTPQEPSSAPLSVVSSDSVSVVAAGVTVAAQSSDMAPPVALVGDVLYSAMASADSTLV